MTTPAPIEAASASGIAPLGAAAEMHTIAETLEPVHGPSYHEIAVAAYLRYLERGGEDGRDVDDWIAAESELKRLSVG